MKRTDQPAVSEGRYHSFIPYDTELSRIDTDGVAIGSKIGVAIRMIGAISMIHPKMSEIKSTNSAITIGLLENDDCLCVPITRCRNYGI